MAVVLEDPPPGEWTGYLRVRARMDGAATTVHALALALSAVAPRLVQLDPAAPLAAWCARHGVADAISGGFYRKPELVPLGEHRVGGRPIRHAAFGAPWRDRRPVLLLSAGRPTIAPRGELTIGPDDDVLQAGPLLVHGGRPALSRRDEDPEGFSTQAELFDQDFTKGRLPRAAIGLTPSMVLAVAVDGRAPEDAGLTLSELAHVLVELGGETAINLDGGSSAALVAGGARRNTPRSDDGEELTPGEPVPTAVLLTPGR
jgi:Phosphodiester glycosidase